MHSRLDGLARCANAAAKRVVFLCVLPLLPGTLLQVCCEGGLISIVAYVGHEGGREEYAALRALLAELKPQYWVAVDTAMLNRPKAPGLLLAWRKTQEAEPSWALSEEQ